MDFQSIKENIMEIMSNIIISLTLFIFTILCIFTSLAINNKHIEEKDKKQFLKRYFFNFILIIIMIAVISITKQI